MVASPGSGNSSSSKSASASAKAAATSAKALAAPVCLKVAIFSSASRWLFCRLLERQTEGFDRAFQALEQVGGHQRLQAFFAVSLFELASAAFHLGVVKRFVLFQATGQDVADRRIHRELELRQPVEDFIEADDVGTVRQRAVK
jgi:hypothetical protein